MRILFLHHANLEASPVGQAVARWSAALSSAGHETLVQVVDDRRRADGAVAVDRIVCSADDPHAELPFGLPRLAGEPGAQAGNTFNDLSDEQLRQYRDHLRQRLDALVERFDPHVIHVQCVWVFGQLVVETGVPYAISAWGPELDAAARDARYRPLADQSAVNAGRILTPDRATLKRIESTFDLEPHQAEIAPAALRAGDSTADDKAIAAALVETYQAVLDQRFGSLS